ncbi:MAG: hypothetical protein H3Z50_01095 [archaeon]|nr:hypothetical protein [archaeon]MCP8306290.1 hypothetical protein [archaeon]
MSEKELPPAFQGGVQLQSALMGLTLAFKQKYDDAALKITEAFVEKMGVRLGNQIKEKAGIKGSSIQDIELVLHSWMDPAVLGPPPKTKVEGKKLIAIRESPTQCPALYVSKQLNVPLETVCRTIAFPMFRGVFRAINPDAKHSNTQISEQRCVDIIKVP